MVRARRKKEDLSFVPPLEMYSRIINGERKTFPNNYLDKEAVKEIVRYVVLIVYRYTREDVLNKVNHEFFHINHIGGVRKFFQRSDIEVLIHSFPEWNFKCWEFKRVHPAFWTVEDNRKEFILWIAKKENLDTTKKNDLRKITAAMVRKYGGHKAIVAAGGMYELLNAVAKGKYKKWEIIAMSSWSDSEAVEATKWLIEERLKYTPEQACNISLKDFRLNNLDGMIQKKYNRNTFKALDMAYPGMYFQTETLRICLKV